MKKILITIMILCLFFPFLFYKLYSDSINKDLKQLAMNSINYQYSQVTGPVKKIYTNEFLKIINNKDNEVKLGKNYKIISLSVIEKKMIRGKYIVNVNIQDDMGEYLEHIYIIKYNGKFLIYNIEYDK